VRAITIKQPWASLIIEGGKDIENRTRRTHVRGWVLVHAGQKQDDPAMVREWGIEVDCFTLDNAHALNAVLDRENPYLGGIIGAMHLADCVEHHSSPWFGGPFGYVIDRVVKLPFLPCRGMQGWFNVELPAEMEALIPKV
jgi:hypothetical protein